MQHWQQIGTAWKVHDEKTPRKSALFQPEESGVAISSRVLSPNILVKGLWSVAKMR